MTQTTTVVENSPTRSLRIEPWLKIIRPPAQFKDVREWIKDGATKDEIESVIKSAEVFKPTLRYHLMSPQELEKYPEPE